MIKLNDIRYAYKVKSIYKSMSNSKLTSLNIIYQLIIFILWKILKFQQNSTEKNLNFLNALIVFLKED